MDWARLRQLMGKHFNDEELRTLCFDLSVDYDSLKGDGKESKIRELIAYMKRHSSLDKLILHLNKVRASVSWPNISSDIDQGEISDSEKENENRVELSKESIKPRIGGCLFKFAAFFPKSREEAIHQRNRDIMLEKVEVFWVKGVLENSLHGALLLQLGMKYRPELVEHSWDMILQKPYQKDRILNEGTTIHQVFDELAGSLLILGEPGSGKTTALLELARGLISHARFDNFYPIPVIFNLSSWATQKKPISDWLIDELNSKYDIPESIARMWIQGDELLLLLDGLDEVRDIYQNECVEAINSYRREHMVRMAVCSRTEDYQILTKRLTLSGAIVQQPLAEDQIDDYLISLGNQLEGVRRAIKVDDALQKLARSPLVLSIIALAYQGITFNDFSIKPLEDRQKHLFSAYVARMFEHRRIQKYGIQEVIHGLIWLSRLMKKNAQTVFHIEQLQPKDFADLQSQKIYAVSFLFIAWLFTGMFVALPTGISFALITNSLSAGIISAVLYGLTASTGMFIANSGKYQLKYRVLLGLLLSISICYTVIIFTNNVLLGVILGSVVGFTTSVAYNRIGIAANAPRSEYMRINTTRKRLGWSWRVGRVGFLKRLPLGLVFGSVSGLTAGLAFGWTFGIAVAVILGLTFAIAGAISYGMIDVNVETMAKPNEGIRRAIENSLRFGVISGLWTGLAIGFLGYLLTSAIGGVLIGVSFFAAGFWISGIIAGGITVIKHIVLRFLLHWQEGVPLQYVRFLNQAAYHIFLRRVGGGYIFVHRLLLEHFATVEQTVPKIEPK